MSELSGWSRPKLLTLICLYLAYREPKSYFRQLQRFDLVFCGRVCMCISVYAAYEYFSPFFSHFFRFFHG